MKRILSLMLAMLMLAATFASCVAPSGEPNDTTPAETTPEEVIEETPAETLPPLKPEEEIVLELVKNRSAKAKVIYPAGDTVAETIAKELRYNVILKYSANLSVVSDAEVEYDADAIEILVGATNRPESELGLKYLKYNSYGLMVIGKKFVVAGWMDDTLRKAYDEFVDKYATEGGTVLKVSSDDNYAPKGYYKDSAKKILGVEMQNYRIVLPENYSYTEYRFAMRLQWLVGMKNGAVLPIVTDSEPATAREILVGKTNRTASEKQTHKYSVNVKGKTVELVADSFYGYDYLYNYCEDSLLYDLNGASENAGMIVDQSYAEALRLDGSDSFLEKTGELRIVYNNVFGFNLDSLQTPNHSCMPEIRNPMIAEFYAEFGADVVCFEEITSVMRGTDPVTKLMEEFGYKEVPAGDCTTPIMYNTSTLELLAGGDKNFHQYLRVDSKKSPYDIQTDKYMTWAVFRVKATGKVFGVINVHLDSFDTHGVGSGAAKAKAEVELIISTVSDMVNEYSCPVLVGGDFNTTINEATHATFTKLLFADVKDVAKVSDSSKGYFHSVEHMKYNACIGGGFFTGTKETNTNYAEAVDHIYANTTAKSQLTFNKFDVLSDGTVASFADHCGMVLDFSFNK